MGWVGKGRGLEGRGQEGKEKINMSTNPPYMRHLGVISNTRVNFLDTNVHTLHSSGESQKEQRTTKVKTKIKVWNGKARVQMDIQR